MISFYDADDVQMLDFVVGQSEYQVVLQPLDQGKERWSAVFKDNRWKIVLGCERAHAVSVLSEWALKDCVTALERTCPTYKDCHMCFG